MNVNNIQSEESCQITAKVNMKQWPRKVSQSRFCWLFTAFSFFTVFKSKIQILFIFKNLFIKNIIRKRLKRLSKLKTKSKKLSFEVIVFSNISMEKGQSGLLKNRVMWPQFTSWATNLKFLQMKSYNA